MPKVTQLRVSCNHQPGALIRIAQLFGNARINILALMATTASGTSFVEVVIDKPEKARVILDAEGVPYTEKPVLQIELPNVPGALASVVEKLAKQNINITAAYHTSVRKGNKTSIVFAVSDIAKAARLAMGLSATRAPSRRLPQRRSSRRPFLRTNDMTNAAAE